MTEIDRAWRVRRGRRRCRGAGDDPASRVHGRAGWQGALRPGGGQETVRRGVVWTTPTQLHDLLLFRVAQHARPAAIPAHLLIPFPRSCPQGQCRYRVRGVQGKRAHREEKLNLQREKLNLWGGRSMMRGGVPPRPRSAQQGTRPGGTTPAAPSRAVRAIRCRALGRCDVNGHALPSA
jgi:hypothetical protein